jgi:hypothetical protein
MEIEDQITVSVPESEVGPPIATDVPEVRAEIIPGPPTYEPPPPEVGEYADRQAAKEGAQPPVPTPTPVEAMSRYRNIVRGREGNVGYEGLHPLLGPTSAYAGQRAVGPYGLVPQVAMDVVQNAGLPPSAGNSAEMQMALQQNPALQDELFNRLTLQNAEHLGTTDPVALALAHYSGPEAARMYLQDQAISANPVMTTGEPMMSELEYVQPFMSMAPMARDPRALRMAMGY